MAGPREWSPRGIKKYTIIGLWADDSQPYILHAEGPSPSLALRAALNEVMHENDWTEEKLENLFIVEIVAGYRYGLLNNNKTISAFKFLKYESEIY